MAEKDIRLALEIRSRLRVEKLLAHAITTARDGHLRSRRMAAGRAEKEDLDLVVKRFEEVIAILQEAIRGA